MVSRLAVNQFFQVRVLGAELVTKFVTISSLTSKEGRQKAAQNNTVKIPHGGIPRSVMRLKYRCIAPNGNIFMCF